jgi:TonB family protein
MCLNNQEARILAGSKEAYITSTVSQGSSGQTVTAQSVNFVDTGIELKVTPTINRDNFITMKIRPQISEATDKELLSAGQKTTVPIITTSEAETSVTVKDGVTLIIGGLKKDKRTKTVKKIPLIGDIPGLGFLFRSTSDDVTKTELVILLTPHIITGESTYSSFSEIKPKEGVVAEMKVGNIVTNKFSVLQKENALEDLSRNPAFSNYSNRVIDRINEYASLNRPQRKKGEVKVSFNLLSKGNLISDPEVISSTDSAITPFAVKAIKDAAPFPPFPEEIKSPETSCQITLEYK